MGVLDALEGRPKRTAQVADMDRKGQIGRGKLYKILDVLENSYGRSVTYKSLVGELCSIQQKRGETPKLYYEHLTTIILLLQECHQGQHLLYMLSHLIDHMGCYLSESFSERFTVHNFNNMFGGVSTSHLVRFQ